MEILGAVMIAVATLYATKSDQLILRLLVLGGSLLVSYGASNSGEMKVYDQIAGEVIVPQISVRGEYHSTAQIDIVHRDGKLASVALVRGTTVSKE